MSKYISKILLERHEILVLFDSISIAISVEYFPAYTSDNTFSLAHTYVLFKNKSAMFSSIFLPQQHNKDDRKALIKRIKS